MKRWSGRGTQALLLGKMREKLHEEKTVMACCCCWKGGCHGWLRLAVERHGWGWVVANLDPNECCGRDSQLEAKLLMLEVRQILLLLEAGNCQRLRSYWLRWFVTKLLLKRRSNQWLGEKREFCLYVALSVFFFWVFVVFYIFFLKNLSKIKSEIG